MEDRGGDVPAGSFDDGAQPVEGAAEAARQGVGGVDRDELTKDGVHAGEQCLGPVEPLGPVGPALFAVKPPEADTWAPVTFYELPTGERYLHFGVRATPRVD